MARVVGQRLDGVARAAAGRRSRGRRGSGRSARAGRPGRAGRPTPPSSGTPGRPPPSAPAGCRGRDTRSCRPRTGWSRSASSFTVASRIMPVRPMPPTVAQNSSGRRSGPSSTTLPSARSSDRPRDVVAERPVDVMVLAVDVAGDRPADRDEPGAGRDRDEEAARHDQPQQVVDAHARRGSSPLPWRRRARRRARVPAGAGRSRPPFCAGSPYERPSPRAIAAAWAEVLDRGDQFVTQTVELADDRRRRCRAPPAAERSHRRLRAAIRVFQASEYLRRGIPARNTPIAQILGSVGPLGRSGGRGGASACPSRGSAAP